MLPLTGYTDKLSARPGESIEFKVSSQLAGPYTARLVRVISADANPAGPGIREEPIASALDGRSFPSRFQPAHLGSHAVIEVPRAWSLPASYTLIATIWPTTLHSGKRQGILSSYDPTTRTGCALAIAEDGSIEALLGTERVKTRVKLKQRGWHRVWMSYDAPSRTLVVGQMPLDKGRPAGATSTASLAVPSAASASPPAGMRWLIAALGGLPIKGHFNGKIEAPTLVGRVLTASEAAGFVASDKATPAVLAHWNLAYETATARIVDTGPSALDGVLINLPARAMTGSTWTGREMCFRHASDEYGAIHFHEDDLYDCGWRTDFSFTIPAGLRSGMYAVRIEGEGGADNMPFAVLPVKAERTADICVLVSTYTWTVYHNNARPESTDPVWMKAWHEQTAKWGGYPHNPGQHREYGLSTYNYHTDGSGICHASWLRPMLTMRIGFMTYPYDDIRGSGLRHFPADMHLITWLEDNGYAYDVITDEELDNEGHDLIAPYRVVMTGSHPEYHTGAMLDALTRYRDAGGRFMYMGGNGFYWKVARHRDLPAVIEIRRAEGGIRAWAAEVGEYYNAFDGEYGGLWRRNGRPPQHLAGVGFTAQGNFIGSYYRVSDTARASRAGWILEGVSGEKIGDHGLSGHGAAGFELDRADTRLGTPPHAIVLAQSEGHKPDAPWVLVPEEQLTHLLTLSLEPIPKLIRADLTFFEAPNNGAVFSTGSITYCGSLLTNGGDNDISRITRNVLDRFLDPNARFDIPSN